MNAAFIALLAIYVIAALFLNRRAVPGAGGTPGFPGFALQAPLLILAIVYAWRSGVFSRDLVAPWAIGLGLAGGHVIFGLSLLVTDRNLRAAASHLLDMGALWNFLAESPALLFRMLAVSLAEELIYRVAAQGMLLEWTGSPPIAIVVVAAAFAVVHWHFFRNPPLQSAEFMGFALLLGTLYHWSGSFVLVVAIHTVRNLEILYLEYLVKLEELGDVGAALDAVASGQFGERREQT